LPVAQAGHEDGYLDAIKVSWDDSDRGKGPVGMAIRTGKPVIIRDIDTDINFAPWREEAHKRCYFSVAGLPLTIEKEMLGSLTIYASETDAFNLSEVELLQELAVNLAYGIKSLRALEDRKRADKALRESEDRYRSLVDNMDLGISLIGSDKEVLMANAALSKIFNKPMSDLLKGKCFCKFENQAGVCPDCPRETVFRTGKTSSVVREVVRPDGIRMVIKIHAFALNVSGERRCIEVVEDITDKKMAEEEKLHLENQLRHSQKMEAIGTLAGGVAHDFNNILTCILGYCSLMEMKIADYDPLRAYPAKIMASANRAAVLTQGLLTYSRKQPLHPRPVDVNEVVEQVEHMLARLLNEEIELSIHTVKTPLTVLADSLQIEQVLINLATNARDAMPRGGMLQIATGWLEMDVNFIKAHGYGKPGSYALITVSDTGAGMDDGTKKRIFEPFYTTKEVGKGTGLGLSITYGIVKQHDGFINVDSEVGKGTTFAIYLPLTDIQGVVQPQTLQMIPATGNETVLLVEDDEALRNTLKEILENSGYRVIGAVDGEDGFRKFQEYGDKIQLLILDVIMPKKNGRQLNEEIQAQSPGTKAVFISGYTADILSARGTLQDDTILITKPLASHTLLTKIREVLDK
ncbi:MAG: response regulator, partial [Geobacter sp.]